MWGDYKERLPQRAGSPGLNGGGTAAAVQPSCQNAKGGVQYSYDDDR